MDVNLMVLSPRMPLCNALFARHAELIETNTWAVEPSGCLIEDMNNGYCKVRCSAWNVQTHPLMMPLL
jgi:hypothetical protein